MIANLKPYPTMKDCGVPWLGKVPKHWTLQRLDRLFSLRSETPLDDDQRVTGYLDGRVTLRSNVVGQKIKGVVKEAGWQRVHPGDFAISGMNAHLGGMGVSDSIGKCSPIYLILKPKEDTNAAFVSHAVRHAAHSGALKALVNTIRFNSADFKNDDLKLIVVPVPTNAEQAAIVRFLDYAGRRIRRYIRAKQKLIKLLEEQKQAIIHRAVTHGLDPNVRLKRSGVEWLGEVPEHWQVTQIRSVAHVVRGGSPRPAGSPVYFHGTDAPWITVGELTKDSGMYLAATATRLTPAGAERSRMIEAGTLLLTNSGATLGIPKISLIQGCINDGVAAFLKLRPTVNKEFLCLYWSTQTTHLKAWVDLGAQPNLNTQIIGGWPFLLLPNGEQEAIVHHIHRETATLADAMKRAHREITLVHEYRTRLIADVVTGKLDVRAAAASLPDEADESDLLEESEAMTEGEEDSAVDDVDPEEAAA